MNFWIVFIIIIVAGLTGALIYKLSNESCITIVNNGGVYELECRNGVSQSDCSSQNGLYQRRGCQDSSTLDTQYKSQLEGSCVTSTGCQYPVTQPDCKSSRGVWKAGNSCYQQTAGPSVLGSLWT